LDSEEQEQWHDYFDDEDEEFLDVNMIKISKAEKLLHY